MVGSGQRCLAVHPPCIKSAGGTGTIRMPATPQARAAPRRCATRIPAIRVARAARRRRGCGVHAVVCGHARERRCDESGSALPSNALCTYLHDSNLIRKTKTCRFRLAGRGSTGDACTSTPRGLERSGCMHTIQWARSGCRRP
jgi:hypothetical protein